MISSLPIKLIELLDINKKRDYYTLFLTGENVLAGITSKGVYGLSAMFELSQTTGAPMQIKQIAELANVPQNYLEQLLPLLRKQGLLRSIRGASGGYELAKSAKEIRVFEILEALEGDFCAVSAQESHPTLTLFWQEKHEQTHDLYDLSLQDLQQYRQSFTYTI